MSLNNWIFFLKGAAVAAVISGAFVLSAVSASAEPGKANPKGNPNCDGNTPITSPARPCKGNNGFGNGGGDGTPNGKQDQNR
jgi:hypothetical protein